MPMTRIPDTQGQTPIWLPPLLLERHFPALSSADMVLEPSCGRGSFLRAIPADIPAIGVEIDPGLAAQARLLTGRTVIEGDFRTVAIDSRPTVVIGNPVFRARLIREFLARCHDLLPEGGKVGFVLPTDFFQYSMKVLDLAEHWSLAVELMPKDIFGNLPSQIAFAIFTKDRRRAMWGLAMYEENAGVLSLPAQYRMRMVDAPRPLWRDVVEAALRQLGGEADLSEIYAEVEGRRPTGNRFWRPKIRQVLQVDDAFSQISRGRWALTQARRAA